MILFLLWMAGVSQYNVRVALLNAVKVNGDHRWHAKISKRGFQSIAYYISVKYIIFLQKTFNVVQEL